MKLNKLYRCLKRLGVNKRILFWLFRSCTTVYVFLPVTEGKGDNFCQAMKLTRRLISKGYKVKRIAQINRSGIYGGMY